MLCLQGFHSQSGRTQADLVACFQVQQLYLGCIREFAVLGTGRFQLRPGLLQRLGMARRGFRKSMPGILQLRLHTVDRCLVVRSDLLKFGLESSKGRRMLCLGGLQCLLLLGTGRLQRLFLLGTGGLQRLFPFYMQGP